MDRLLQNTSDKDSPILADIQSLDFRLERAADAREPEMEFRLHHHVGSPCTANDYQPLETVLTPGLVKRITGAGGRPTNSDLPYFNLKRAPNEGLIIVVGWPGSMGRPVRPR